MPDSEFVEAKTVTIQNAGDQGKAIEDLTEKGLPQLDPATARVNKDTETPAPSTSDKAHPLKTMTIEVEGHDVGSSVEKKHVQRRAKSTATSVPERFSANRYHQVPRGTEKMFEQNWQSKAFLYE